MTYGSGHVGQYSRMLKCGKGLRMGLGPIEPHVYWLIITAAPRLNTKYPHCSSNGTKPKYPYIFGDYRPALASGGCWRAVVVLGL